MGTPRARRPETEVLPISGGDTITVKKHLTSGESRAMVRQMYVTNPVTGESSVGNPVDIGEARVLTYLLDWTCCGQDGQPIVIYRQPPEVVRAALDGIDPECYTDILEAIKAHDVAMVKARLEKKTVQAGETTSSATSPSPSDAGGGTSGSAS